MTEQDTPARRGRAERPTSDRSGAGPRRTAEGRRPAARRPRRERPEPADEQLDEPVDDQVDEDAEPLADQAPDDEPLDDEAQDVDEDEDVDEDLGEDDQTGPSRIGARQAARAAVRQLADMGQRHIEGVVGVHRDEDGWEVAVVVVEDRHVPSTADILAEYEVRLDDDGELVGFRRRRRYVRGRAGE